MFMFFSFLFFFFFFSSRRRHTRSLRDWSSDVCSSDLGSSPRSGGACAGRPGVRLHASRRYRRPALRSRARRGVGRRLRRAPRRVARCRDLVRAGGRSGTRGPRVRAPRRTRGVCRHPYERRAGVSVPAAVGRAVGVLGRQSHARRRARVPLARRAAAPQGHGAALCARRREFSPRAAAQRGARRGRGARVALRPDSSLALPGRACVPSRATMRSHYCGQVNETLLGRDITVAGWVHRRRDHGGVIFVDLRDREGLLQIIFDPEAASVFTEAERLRNEFVVRVTGRVRERPPGTVNANLASGRVELVARELELLNRSEPLPFQLDEQVGEEVRLRYRYLDLRREVMSERLRLRHRITRSMRGYLDTHGFIDLETPMLTKATPEGARDYLVPSRTHPGKFFALPQSPQIFKQLLMIAGFDRYYQIVRCFRDEDLRADRQPEFTQLDIETSFLAQDEIMGLMEELVRHFFREVLGAELPRPFPRITYAHALRRYASDKPDLRIALELVDVAELVKACDFKVFAGPAKDAAGRVVALRVPGGGALPRSQIDDYTAFVARYGAKGLAYLKVNARARGRDGLQSPIIKFLSDAALAGILERTGAADNDLIFFGADTAKVVNDSLDALRLKIGQDLKLLEPGWRPLWVVDFPMFEWDADEKRWAAMHHPFTSPRNDDPAALAAAPGAAIARAYDMVLNGSEIGGGSVRIHRSEMQSTVFGLLGIAPDEAQKKFGFLLDALKFGAPPHGGIAFGLDRLAMLMTGAESVRAVLAFPMTQTAADPLTDAPTEVSEAQLRELHIRVRVPRP